MTPCCRGNVLLARLLGVDIQAQTRRSITESFTSLYPVTPDGSSIERSSFIG